MPRFPDSFIAELKDRVDLLALISRHVQLKKSGGSWLGLCPFHQEKTPSFSVRPDQGYFKCFGCGQGGDALEFLIKIKGMDFNEAVEELATEIGLALPAATGHGGEAYEGKNKKAELHALMTEVRDLYHGWLMGPTGKQALRYLQERGLTAPIIQRFHLGYAPSGWQTLAKHYRGMTEVASRLVEVGLRVNRGDTGPTHDRFRDRIIFPIHDIKGRCVGFGGRTMDPQGKPKYINSPETVLYQKGSILYGLHQAQETIQKHGEVILVEGYMDLISLVSHGVENCVASLGTALTDEQVQLLWKRSRRVVYCFDGDHAGRQAAWKALEKSFTGLEADRHVRFLFLPQGQDPDQFIRLYGRGKFLHLVEKAIGIFEFLTEKLAMDLSLATPEGKAALVHRVRPYLNRVSDPLLKQLLTESLAQKVGIAVGRIIGDQRPGPMLGKNRFRNRQQMSMVPQPELRGRDWEQTLLGIVLRFPHLISEFEEQLAALELQNQSFARLLRTLVAMGSANSSTGQVDLNSLPERECIDIAAGILVREEVVPDVPEEELKTCLRYMDDRGYMALQKQVQTQDLSDNDVFAESFRISMALQKERNKLAPHRSSDIQ
ncbi:MAG: DNA primase [Magnetococcales bacterium]|nr:DNA primase [Magnetococcales bacterium]